MKEIRINIHFSEKLSGAWKDSHRRSDHLIDRMRARGIGIRQMKEAIEKGAKTLRSDGSLISEYRWLKVAYREFRFNGVRKIYPITIVEVY